MSVLLDPDAGVAHLGTTQVPIRLSGSAGALQISGDGGPIVRPLTFSERTRLAGHAAASRTPRRAMGRLIADAALAEPGEADSRIVAIVAMTLAGGNESGLPAFTEAALLIARAVGWSPEQLGHSDAVEVDRLTRFLMPTADDGWTRLLFNRPAETDLDAIHDLLAENLLVRLQPTGLAERFQQQGVEATPRVAHTHPSAPPSSPAPGHPARVEQFDVPAGTEQPLPAQATPAVQPMGGETGEVRRMDPYGLLRNSTVRGTGAAAGSKPSKPDAQPAPSPGAPSPMDADSPAQPSVHTIDPAGRAGTGPGPMQTSAQQDGRAIRPPDELPASPAFPPRPLQALPPSSSQVRPGRQTVTWPEVATGPDRDAGSFGGTHEPFRWAEGLPAIASAQAGAGRTLIAEFDQAIDLADIVDEIAARLHMEADLRGIDR